MPTAQFEQKILYLKRSHGKIRLENISVNGLITQMLQLTD